MEKKGKVRQARAAETRKRIVAAAKKLITENGFENVSIEEIAKEAEVSTGSFYTYFKKKEDVIEELNQLSFYRLAEITNEMKDKGLDDRLKYYCRQFLAEIERVGSESRSAGSGSETISLRSTWRFPVRKPQNIIMITSR